MTEVTFEGDAVITTDPDSMPSRREQTLAEAFAGSGRMLFVRDPDRLTEVLRTLAGRLGDLPGRDGVRQQDRASWLEVDGAIARRPEKSWDLGWQTRRDWTWNQQSDGEEGATLEGATLTVGYQFGHDMGWSEHAVERVLTRAPEIFLNAPATACDELYAALATAVAA